MSVTDKIAREILSGTDGDYDLAGYDTMQVETLVSEAFSAPITCTEMMRYRHKGTMYISEPPGYLIHFRE